MALAAFLWTSCSDDELYRSNELGSRLEEMGDFKLSSFTLEKGIWEIADTIQQIKIHLKSHTDDSIRAYDAAVLHSESNPSYSIYIPKTDEIPDSDYDLTAFLMDGTKLGTKLKVTFRDEMLHTIMASTVQYDLEGEGTAEKPYLIGHRRISACLNMALTVMIPSHTQPGSILNKPQISKPRIVATCTTDVILLASPLPVYTMVTASLSRSPISVHRQRVIPLSVFLKHYMTVLR